MEQGLLNLIQAALEFLNNCFTDIRAHLSTTPAEFGGGEIWDVVTQVNSGLQGIGYGLLILFFLMSFFRTVTNFRDMSLQQVIGMIARFLIVKAVIDYGVQILNFVISISMGMNDAVFQNAGQFQFAEVPQEVIDAVANMQNAEWYERLGAFFQSIPMYIVGGVSMLIIWGCGIVMCISVFLRFFKVYVMCAIAPIGFSFWGSQETSQTAKHFLKAFFAVCIEIAIIGLALVIFNAMVSQNTFIFPSWTENIGEGANWEYWNVMLNYLLQLCMQTVMLAIFVSGANKTVREMLGV